MSFVTGTFGHEATRKFVEVLQSDFKSLAQEARKKYPHIKESCDEAVAKLSSASTEPHMSIYYVVNQILYPLVQGCETKDSKICKFCLGMMQRLITQQVVDQKGARYITDAMWVLMENSIEDVKVLQTITLLLTTNSVVHGETLSKALVLCFRLYFAKDMTTVNTACATIRQLVSLVFERFISSKNIAEVKIDNKETSKIDFRRDEVGEKEFKSDALNLFQDLVQLVNADQPFWLHGMTEMTRTFGLELLENILSHFSPIFYYDNEFKLLLKERVCALVIKLFSPNVKQRPLLPTGPVHDVPHDKPYFPISIRLLRLVSIIIEKYQSILVTECEIFLSLIVKFLDTDKPVWQRALALEVIHRICTKPFLLEAFCSCYDLRDHATNIFEDIINSLGTYIQNLFLNISNTVSSQIIQSNTANTCPTASSLSAQSGFLFKGYFLPLIMTYTPSQAKFSYLDMLDKTEPPNISEGYGISLSYACLLDTINSLSLIISGSRKDNLSTQLIKSSWSGLLTGVTPLLDAALEESTCEHLLKAMQTYIYLCGEQELNAPRDAFIITICKASLPSHYALSIFDNSFYRGIDLKCIRRFNSSDVCGQVVAQCGENDFRHQVVAVGTPLPTASLPSTNIQGPVMLTAKNLQCMRALLRTANNYGSFLGSSWYIVLLTLQHLVWILGLKPSTGGSLQAVTKPAFDSIVGIQTAVVTDLPVLSQMLSELFETSKLLNDAALISLIEALCKLSHEAMELAYNNREPSLFAVAKLLETGLVNLPRIGVVWRPLTNHLLEVCQHRHIRMREWGVEAITYLVKAALQFKYDTPLKHNLKLQTLLLNPLAELSNVHHGDVRQRQLECVLQILNGTGETLTFGWPLILGVVGAVNDHHGEALIRIAFQCLQLIVTDFLPAIPWQCLPLCVTTAANFGSQTQDLNISLTAVGLMWNISDYFSQSLDELLQDNSENYEILPDFPGIVDLPQVDKLWMCLYTKLGNLCVDIRPAVRKSAGQTLFSTIAAHGNLLRASTWQAVLWQVLFPLLDKVRSFSSSASNEKVDTSGAILIHHTRNTAQKQWAETEVLTLSGVSRVFNTKRELLQTLGDFPKAWALLLEFVENSSLSKNYEVSLAALKSFQEILYDKSDASYDDVEQNSFDIWKLAWQIWLKIGIECTRAVLDNNDKNEELYIPSQAFLTALVQIFPAVFRHIRKRFDENDLLKLSSVLMNAVILPVQSEVTPFVISTVTETQLTPLHDGILECMDILQKEALSELHLVKNMIPAILRQYLSFSEFACLPPSVNSIISKWYKPQPTVNTDYSTVEWVSLNYIPFSEKSVSAAVRLYELTANNGDVIQERILHEFVKTLKTPLALKYKCISSSTWKLSIHSLLKILPVGLRVARKKQYQVQFSSLWADLADVLNIFLFPKSSCTVEDRGLEEIVLDEAIDCQVIELLKEEILPYSSDIPQEFILQVIMILNRGSIHTATMSEIATEPDWKLREIFAKTCFETLLQFSLLDDTNSFVQENDFAGRLAVTALLHRFQEVVKRFNDDERISGKFPLPRYRLTEISFVLKAIATLTASMKKAPSNRVSDSAWEQLIALFSYLVDCTATSSPEVLKSLREALQQYGDLLQSPKTSK